MLAVRMLREELQLLQEQGSYVGEVVKPMDKKKVLVKVKSRNISLPAVKLSLFCFHRYAGMENAVGNCLVFAPVRWSSCCLMAFLRKHIMVAVFIGRPAFLWTSFATTIGRITSVKQLLCSKALCYEHLCILSDLETEVEGQPETGLARRKHVAIKPTKRSC